MNGKKFDWWFVIWRLGMSIKGYEFLLVDLSMYRKKHPKVKSIQRLAYYVLRKNYSTTSMIAMAFCADHIDEYMEWLKNNGL